jgi:hypothetical protein
MAAIIVASLTAIGTLAKVIIDVRTVDELQTVVAAEVAKNDQRWEAIEDLIDSAETLQAENKQLLQSVASLKTAVEFLTRDQNWKARREAEAVDVSPQLPSPVPSRASKPVGALRGIQVSNKQVQQTKANLFKD